MVTLRAVSQPSSTLAAGDALITSQRLELEKEMSYPEMGTGICGNCQQPVGTLNGRYTCTTCGSNG